AAELGEVLPAIILHLGLGPEVPLERLAGATGLLLLPRLGDVEHPQEHQERDLLDDRQRVRDPALPELGPEPVHVVLQLSGDHRVSPPCVSLGGWYAWRMAIRSSIWASSKTPSTPLAFTIVKGSR